MRDEGFSDWGFRAAVAAGVTGVLALSVGAAAPEQAAVPTFSKDVAPILYKNCTSCHRPGEVAPMSLLTYADARPYARAIRDDVSDGIMPPWHAEAPHGTFLNERRLTAAEKDVLVKWASNGAPEGDPKDLPPAPTYAEGWAIGTPDAVFELEEPYKVPADGIVQYEYLYIPTNFTEPKWVKAIEVRPGARSVVHHVLVYYRAAPDMQRTPVLQPNVEISRIPPRTVRGLFPPRRGLPPQRLLATYAPGTNPQVAPEGTAFRLEPGGILELQMHYTTAGEETLDRTKVGFVFAKESDGLREIRASHFLNATLNLPAGAADVAVDADLTFLQDTTVWGIFPHTHLRGKKWRYVLELPDGTKKTVLDVPRYDFNWQTYYMFREPLEVPQGAKLVSTAWYDNSARNPANPDPKVDVKWGDQTWEEMQYTGLLFSPAKAAPPAPAPDVPTFSKDVAPILYKNCTGCHRPGEIAPMSLLTYEEARPYAAAIRDEVSDGTMPPWHADPKHGKFLNDRSLSASEKDTILRWARGGAPKGDPKDMPAAPKYAEGWELGQPDVVLAMPVDYQIPADGFVEYEYFEVPTNFTEDKWIQAIEVRPGNRAVVHHVIVSTRPPAPERRPTGFRAARGMEIPPGQTGGGAEKGEIRRTRGQSLFPAPRQRGAMIGGFAPGTTSMSFEPGSALLIRAGSTIVMQMHYTTNGTEQTDRSKIGLTFAKAPPQREMRMGTLVNGTLRIPPRAADYSIAAEMTTTAAVTLRQMLPHTHLRGKRWEYTVTYPDGRSQVILAVPRYDFNWQTDYVFAEPLTLPAGTTIRAVAWYDNSRNNPSNPDPSVEVRWGDQTWEEMMFTSFVYSIDGVKPGTVLPPPQQGR